MAGRELDLNSISRFSKQSPRLVLEEHSACEVPAGCGGVVLRWRGPNDPIPVWFSIFTTGEHTVFLDGNQITSTRPLVAPGEHLLSFRLETPSTGGLVLMFSGYSGDKEAFIRAAPESEAAVQILSLPDGSWRCSTREPPDDSWMRPGYDDSAWLPMVRKRLPSAGPRTLNAYWIRRLQDFGAQPIGAPGRARTLWVRKPFSLTPPEQP